MNRKGLSLFIAGTVFLAGNLVSHAAYAQCRGGGQGTTGTTATAGVLRSSGSNAGAGMLAGPGSLAYDMMMAQAISQQMAQQQMMLAMQQQKMKQEKLAARRYQAEQTRTQVAENRARTRTQLAAQNGLSPAKRPAASLVAYQPIRR